MPESGPLGSVRGDRGNPVPYRDTTDDVSKALGDIKTGDECPSQEQHGGGLLIGHVVSGIQVA